MSATNERIDDLLTHDLRIIQSPEVFSFSLDAVLLARFASVPSTGEIADLCSGNGVIPLLLSTRSKANIVGVEIQSKLCDMAQRSVEMNGLQSRIRMELADLRSWSQQLQHHEKYDLVTVNPPYLPVQQGQSSKNEHVAIARHELFCTLEDVATAAGRLVRNGGRAAIVHRPSRIVDLLESLRRNRLEPKRIRFVHPKAASEANMVLVEAIKGGKPEVRLLPPLIVHNEDNGYCDELQQVFYGKSLSLDHEVGAL